MFSWFYWGLRSLIAPVIFSSVLLLACATAVSVVRLVASIPALRARLARVSASVRAVVAPRVSITTATAAQSLLLAHVAVLAVLAVYFAPLLDGFMNFMTRSPDSLEALSPSNGRTHERFGYLMTAQLLAFSVLWAGLLRLRSRRGDREGTAFIVAGVAAIAISAFMFTARFMILAHNKSERVVYDSQPCYLVEVRDPTVLLFCPLAYPRNVVASSADIERTGHIENIFTPLNR